MKPNTEKENLRAEHTVSILNILEADEYFLLTKIRSAHRDAITETMEELAVLLIDQSTTIDKIVDQISEKAHALGQTVTGSLKDFLRLAHFNEQKHFSGNPIATIQNLVENHETIVYFIKDLLKISDKTSDMAVIDFLTDILKIHENMIRNLKACYTKPHAFRVRIPVMPQQEYELTA